MKLSLMTLGDQITDPVTGVSETAAQRHRAIVEAAAIADEAGFHGIHIGEHHGLEYTTSAPPVVLAGSVNARGSSACRRRSPSLPTSTRSVWPRTMPPWMRCLPGAARSSSAAETSHQRVTLFGQSIDDSHELFHDAVTRWSSSRSGKQVTGLALDTAHQSRLADRPEPLGAIPPLPRSARRPGTRFDLAARLRTRSSAPERVRQHLDVRPGGGGLREMGLLQPRPRAADRRLLALQRSGDVAGHPRALRTALPIHLSVCRRSSPGSTRTPRRSSTSRSTSTPPHEGSGRGRQP